MAPSLSALFWIALFAAIVLGCAAWVVRRYAVAGAARRAATVLRLDAPALAIGGLVLAGGAVAVWRTARLDAVFVSALSAVLFVAAACCLAIAAANLDWWRWSRSLPVSTPDEVDPGPVQVEGTVAALDDLVPSSVTQTESVAYRAATLSERAVLGRGYEGSVWAPVSTAFDAVPFALAGDRGESTEPSGEPTETSSEPTETSGDAERASEDAAAQSVRVDAAAAEFPLLVPQTRLFGVSPVRRTLAGLERTVPAEPGTTVPIGDDLERGERPRPRRYSERRIDPGNDVYVLGTAERTDDGLRIAASDDGPPLIVARCDAETARAHARRLTVTTGLLGVATLALACWLSLGVL